ncbi:hypothetical protein ERO13_D13G027048v2 [Gossypium hirsutum]|uniref:Uncharacterized protein n=6 Tax=Gossypium TaxID=3633 RepID=A0A1U8KUD1_GOSHI|nr:uncharacterized protein LOC105784164 [Gossypium raimondii]XP_016704613.1 uncharacterized protein LOC107919743 [Gossypium hirsutum]KAB1993448.1 hypothetical protein ES319_D13G030800v1 [Gossypium barbadense]TYG36038.1 hypothetical protein ES288_D13G032100v1 [Gossypium darwinii]TYH33042.1 hypothetical protein ES332_D13G030800v1 [Gossypium tomentosum]TYI45358.1 hypothetical protein E1A91_D13G031100v1 [Gossypium mustelinum]KAG4110081.1 hypothetical protein ERO13_D13G027048v2 [Gossypium hirsutum
MVIIKSPFPLILCCYLLVSFVFFPQGTVSRKLLGEEGGNGPSKAGVRKSKSQPAPSWGGQGSHPAASNQVSRTSSSPFVVYSRQTANNPTDSGWNCKNSTTNNVFVLACSSANSYSNNPNP